jgi:wyosine [tRNA(Phe)-imidazoG37] synthetase (radical SAM superfamily)
LSNALRAQKNAEDESCQIALGNLQTEVIRLRIEALENDKIMLSLVDRVKASEAKLTAQSEALKAEVEDLKKKLAEKNEDFEVAKAKQEIREWTAQDYKRMWMSFVNRRRDIMRNPWFVLKN